MASEFFRHAGRPVDVCIGRPIACDTLKAIGDRQAVMDHLRTEVHALADIAR